VFYDPRNEAHGLPHSPWMALISPRPIAWISTVSADGVRNLAPYSAFNTICTNPPFVMFSSDGVKDTLRNIQETGVFCVNVPGEGLKDALNDSCPAFAADVDEFEMAGVTSAPCENIPCPRVVEAPVSIECALNKITELQPQSGAPCQNQVVFGEVVGIHISDAVLRNGLVATDLLRPLARMGYRDYCAVTESFEMIRPSVADVEEKGKTREL
jgi:flavin reductase (DIM6/NTAB) family NADH-FMN oxidoreductase RutF